MIQSFCQEIRQRVFIQILVCKCLLEHCLVHSKWSINTWMNEWMNGLGLCVIKLMGLEAWVWILTLILIRCIIQDPSLNFSMPQFPQLWNGNAPLGWLGWSNEWMQVKYPLQGPELSEGSAISLSFFHCHVLPRNSDGGAEKSSKRR